MASESREPDVEMDVVAQVPSNGKGKAREGGLAALELDSAPWVEKYRPVTLSDVVAHQDIISTIDQFIAKNRVPHLLFYGPPGTGKTSTILAVARKIYGVENAAAMKNNCLELNASDERGIDVVREQIKNFASTRMQSQGVAGFKLIILDEADQMTGPAQSALRRVIEQFTKNVRFCIICNYVNKIIPAVQSRCTRFRFGPLPKEEVEKRLNFVVEKENVNLTEDGRQALLELSKGDMRRALNVMQASFTNSCVTASHADLQTTNIQACHAAYDVTDETAIYNCTGNPHPADIDEIMRSMMNDSFETSYRYISSMKAEKGLALQDIIAGVYDYVATVDFTPQTRVYLLDQLGQVEHRLSTGGSEKLQLTALLGATKIAGSKNEAVAVVNSKLFLLILKQECTRLQAAASSWCHSRRLGPSRVVSASHHQRLGREGEVKVGKATCSAQRVHSYLFPSTYSLQAFSSFFLRTSPATSSTLPSPIIISYQNQPKSLNMSSIFTTFSSPMGPLHYAHPSTSSSLLSLLHLSSKPKATYTKSTSTRNDIKSQFQIISHNPVASTNPSFERISTGSAPPSYREATEIDLEDDILSYYMGEREMVSSQEVEKRMQEWDAEQSIERRKATLERDVAMGAGLASMGL
ncbi:replication factor C subunit 3/5, partial [Phenoliferia sp. Uapishka_3]